MDVSCEDFSCSSIKRSAEWNAAVIKPLGFRYTDVMLVMGSFVYILDHNRVPHQAAPASAAA